MNFPKLDQNALFRTTQSILTLGTQRSFPDDWYELNDTVTIYIPDKTVYSALLMTSRDQDYSISASVYQPGKVNNAGKNELEFTIRRPWLVVIYIYLVPAMPFFLLITIAIVTIRHLRRRASAEEPDGHHSHGEMPKHSEIAFGVAATLLAVLPLRSVFVPSSYPSPTRLDLWLGLGAVLLVGFSIIWVVETSRPRHGPVIRTAPPMSPSGVNGDATTGRTDGPPVDRSDLNPEGTSGDAVPHGT